MSFSLRKADPSNSKPTNGRLRVRISRFVQNFCQNLFLERRVWTKKLDSTKEVLSTERNTESIDEFYLCTIPLKIIMILDCSSKKSYQSGVSNTIITWMWYIILSILSKFSSKIEKYSLQVSLSLKIGVFFIPLTEVQ